MYRVLRRCRPTFWHVMGWCLTGWCLLGASPAATARADALDEYIRAAMQQAQIPGASVLIRQDGKVVKMGGYGLANVEHGVAATADTVYQSGSLGKQFTAAGVLLLAAEGRLSLDDRLVRFFPDAPAAWHRISVRQLLTHTSGLRDYGQEFDLRRDYTEAEYLAVVKTIPLDFEPGTQYSYSNTGYLLLGLLVSKLSGRHWSEFLQDRLFAPLGMKSTRVISERDIVMHRAAGYELDAQPRLRNQDWVSPTTNSTGDGALYFSVRDLAAWDAALDARQFMPAALFQAWWTPATLANGTTYPYGFGWRLGEQRGFPLIAHGGSWQGFRSAIHRYPAQRLSIVVLTNLASAEPEQMAQTLAGLIDPALRLPTAGKAVPDPSPERTARLREVLGAYAEYRRVPGMARALADTASGSAREAAGRSRLREQLAAAASMRFVAADDLGARAIDMFGERVARILYYVLDANPGSRGGADDQPPLLRFHLDAQDRVVAFDEL